MQTHKHTHAHVHTHTHKYTYTYTNAHKVTHTLTRTTHAHAHTHAHTHTHTHTRIRTHTLTHRRTRTHTHTHTHTHTQHLLVVGDVGNDTRVRILAIHVIAHKSRPEIRKNLAARASHVRACNDFYCQQYYVVLCECMCLRHAIRCMCTFVGKDTPKTCG